MKKINILAASSEREKILSSLRDSELVEIINLKKTILSDKLNNLVQEDNIDYKHELAELSSAINFLESYSSEKKSLIDAVVGYKIPVKENDYLFHHSKFDYKKIAAQCKVLSAELLNLQSLLGKLKEEYGKLLPWKDLNINLSSFKKLTFSGIVLGKIQIRKFNELVDKISEETKAFTVKTIFQTKTTQYIALFLQKIDEDKINSILSSSEFERIELPETELTPKEELSRIISLIKETKEDITLNSDKAKDLLKHKFDLMCSFDIILQKENDLEAEQKAVRTPYLFMIEGWVTKNSFSKLKDTLSETVKEVELFEVSPEDGEIPPVIINNPPHLQPFETITRIFGLPKYSEIDPTGVLSVFFLIFFGMCLSDAGYGFAMIILSYYMLKKLQLSSGGKKLMQLLMIGGVATIIIGALTGGWFGVELDKIPTQFAPLKNFLLTLRLIDPIRNPIPILGLSIGLGMVQVLFGILIKMTEKIKNGDLIEGILDDAPWLLFLSSVFIYIAGLVASPIISSIAKYFIFAGMISIVLTQGRHKENLIMKFLSGVLSLYNSTSYMGDVLSYSRLLALGMSTAIIGMVVNILATLAGSGVPFFGFAIMVVILIIGHTFNLVVAIMGAFIHSTRLELVEFFTKFFEGGGKEFKPFKRKSKYTLMLNSK